MNKRTTIALFLASATLIGCGKELPPVPEPESRPAKLLPVSVGNIQLTRTFPAVSEAGDKAVLTFRVPGVMQSIDVRAGQKVSKGDVLATLNPDEYEVLKLGAEANFKLADVQFQRMKQLRRDKVVSEQDYDQAKANHNSGNASLSQAIANLSYTKLIAPYEGTISLIEAENHEYVTAKQGVMNIQSDKLLKVVFQMPDYLVNRVSSKGDQVAASVVFDAFSSMSFPVEFQEIDTESNAQTSSYKVTMVMERPEDVGILPGMAGTLTVKLPGLGSSSIPETALIEKDNQWFVWRVNTDNIVELKEITMNDQREVLTGLNDGDQIVVSGVQSIKEGMKVREWVKERGL